MDLGKVLDVTQPVECEFLNHKIVAHVYTSGADRLTKEERSLLSSLNDNLPTFTAEELAALPDDERASKEWKAQEKGIDGIRLTLPVILKGIDLDGTPLTYKGQGFPENVTLYPDTMLIAIGNPVLDFWNKQNPTKSGAEPNGSQPEEKQESSPIELTSLESKCP